VSCRSTFGFALGAALVLPLGLTATASAASAAGGAAGGLGYPAAAMPAAIAPAAKKDPMRLKVVGTKTARVQVQWKNTKRTKKYLVEAFSDARLKKKVASKRTKKNTAWIGGGKIKENQKLWIRITTIDRPKQLKSAKLRVYTGVRNPSAPSSVSARPMSPTTLRVSWSKAKYATAYIVQLAPAVGATPVWSARVESPTTTLDANDLVPAQLGLPAQFVVTVKSDRMGKTYATSSAIPASLPFPAPPTPPTMTIGVGSFNVLGVTYDDAKGRSYWDRVPLLAGQIQAMGADLIGIQESSWSLRAGYPARPILALGAAVGMSVAADPATGAECSTMSDHVLYTPGLYAVETCGEEYLGIDAGFRRYVTWVQFRHLPTGQGLLFGSTHLSVGSSTAVNNLRLTETNLILESLNVHNPQGLPVILTGDFNSTALQFANTPAMVLAAHGLLSADLTAPDAVNAQYGTVHNFTGTNTRGARIDYIFASPKVQVHQFSVQYSAPASDQPSDHYPVRATVSIYP
jgi:endonuclease/exonuclease/phosphatase family metal-dependent hydrolase